MPFSAVWTPEAVATFNELQAKAETSWRARKKSTRRKPTKDEGLFKQVRKCVTLLSANPRHPGLQTHAYHSKIHPYDPNKKVFEAYVQSKTPGAYRLFWCYGPQRDQITILAITLHP